MNAVAKDRMSDSSRVLPPRNNAGVYLCGQDAMALAAILSSPEAKPLRDYARSFGSNAIGEFIALADKARDIKRGDGLTHPARTLPVGTPYALNEGIIS